MKRIHLEVSLPELPGGRMYQVWDGEAASVHTGIARGMKEILNRPGIKRRRLRTYKIVATVSRIFTTSDDAALDTGVITGKV